MQQCPVCLRQTVSTGESRDAKLVACMTCGVYLYAPSAEFALSTLTGPQRDALSAYLRRNQFGERVLIEGRNYLEFVREGSMLHLKSE